MFDLQAITRLLLLPGVLPVFLIKVVSGFPSGQSDTPPREAQVKVLPLPSRAPCSRPTLVESHLSLKDTVGSEFMQVSPTALPSGGTKKGVTRGRRGPDPHCTLC